jgi:hypothetical protein
MIYTKPDLNADLIRFGGYLDKNKTYISFWKNGDYLGSLSGQKLYRLSKAIVRQFEKESETVSDEF